MEQATAVNFYKKGNSIGFIISPLCTPVKDAEGKLTGKLECNEHSHKPEDLTKMLADVKAVLQNHGFETTVFGTLLSMQNSLNKKTGRTQHSEEAVMDFALRHIGGRVIWEEFNEWKGKYYADGGK